MKRELEGMYPLKTELLWEDSVLQTSFISLSAVQTSTFIIIPRPHFKAQLKTCLFCETLPEHPSSLGTIQSDSSDYLCHSFGSLNKQGLFFCCQFNYSFVCPQVNQKFRRCQPEIPKFFASQDCCLFLNYFQFMLFCFL